ncbi:MAG: Gfo/Idh/MocA family protein [Nitrospirota bacterium]
MINIGVIGYGYWGPNIVRNFNGVDSLRVAAICDVNQDALARARKSYPDIGVTTDSDDIVTSSAIDAVAIVTPVSYHFELAKKALQQGKHIFIEKPFTATVAQAEELIDIAEKKSLTIMVDHTFIFTGAVRRMKQIIDDGVLGKLYYYDSIRVNLGLIQGDINVVWDLAPHDFAIMDYLIKDKPLAIASCGKAHVNGHEDVSYITVYFENNMIGHFNVNWLSPVKVRTTLVGGEKKMLVWNDLEADEKIKIYDKGVEVKNAEGLYSLLVSYRSGDMWSPKVEQTEALRLESEYFARCIETGERPINDGHAGLRVVKMLEACNRSLHDYGRMVSL